MDGQAKGRNFDINAFSNSCVIISKGILKYVRDLRGSSKSLGSSTIQNKKKLHFLFWIAKQHIDNTNESVYSIRLFVFWPRQYQTWHPNSMGYFFPKSDALPQCLLPLLLDLLAHRPTIHKPSYIYSPYKEITTLCLLS